MIIFVTSRGQNPSDFTVKVGRTVNFRQEYEIGIKSISNKSSNFHWPNHSFSKFHYLYYHLEHLST